MVVAVNELKAQCESLGRERFVARYPWGFLLRRGALVTSGARAGGGDGDDGDDDHDDDDDDPDDLGAASLAFKTRVVDRRALAAMLAEGASGDAGAPGEWTVVPIEKRKGNPYPDRVSIGRATNCDIVLRVDGVSKLHAHLYVTPAGVESVVDLNSVNGTYVNATRLQPAQPTALRPGDKLRLGARELEFVTAAALWDELCARPRPAVR